MQRVIKDGQQVADNWQLLAPDASIEQLPEGQIIVPLSLWQVHRQQLVTPGDVGVWLEADQQIEELCDDLDALPLIALNFPSFTDGRHYSTARLLRERYGYQGEIRAIGDIQRDQLFYLKRSGFNAFALREDQDPASAIKGLQDFSESYQSAVGELPLFRRRNG